VGYEIKPLSRCRRQSPEYLFYRFGGRRLGKLRNLHGASVGEHGPNLQVRADSLEVAGERASRHLHPLS
jgi:hypothetical protein